MGGRHGSCRAGRTFQLALCPGAHAVEEQHSRRCRCCCCLLLLPPCMFLRGRLPLLALRLRRC